MKSRGRDDAILQECLDRLGGGETVAQCLARYPDQAAELRPALETAWRLREEGAALGPDEGFRRRTRQRLLMAYAQREGHSKARWAWLSALSPRLVAVGAGLLLVMVLGLGSTYRAAAASVPGESLYWLKEKGEQVRLTLARSDKAQAHLNASLAEERAKEGRALLSKGHVQKLSKVEAQFRGHVQKTLKSAGVRPSGNPQPKVLPPAKRQQLRKELSEQLRQQAQRQAHEIQALLKNASPDMKPHLKRLQETLDVEYQGAVQALEEEQDGKDTPHR
ncbi:MAG: hypothetical protein EXR55_02635 [Dehalococcoidia bacterium]|nr:hypothetical protein [Dehalococcoidia bacterium]